MKTCVVLNCTSSEQNNNSGENDIHFFKPPQRKEFFEKWRQNIPFTKGPLTEDSFVCQNHFDTNDVVMTYEKTLLQNKWSVLCKSFFLKPNAVPIFFSIESLGVKINSNSVSQDKSNNCHKEKPTESNECPNILDEHMYSRPSADANIPEESVATFQDEHNQDDSSEIEIIEENEGDSHGETTDSAVSDTDNVEIYEESAPDEYILEEFLDEDFSPSIPLTYQNLILNVKTMKLPNNLWHSFVTPAKDLVSFYGILNDGFLRRVNIYPDLSTRVSIDRVVVPEHYHLELKSINDVVQFLKTVSSWNLCETLKVAKKYVFLGSCEGIAPRYRISGPRRRKCISCSVKWELENEENYRSKRPRKTPQRSLGTLRSVSYLDRKIAKVRKASCEVKEAVLERILRKLTEEQKAPIRECIAAAKRVNIKKGETQVQDNLRWAYKCMITRYSGSRLYDLLKEKEQLPLPSRNILNKYIGKFI